MSLNKIAANTGKVFFGSMDRMAQRGRIAAKHLERGNHGQALKHAAGAVKDHYIAADMAGGGWKRAGTVAARNGVAIGGYLGAATIPRYFSGGGFTTNNQGERDIAGIPFI